MKEKMQITITPELKKLLVTYSERTGATMSSVIGLALYKFIGHRPKHEDHKYIEPKQCLKCFFVYNGNECPHCKSTAVL